MYRFQVILEVSCDRQVDLDRLLDRLQELGTAPGVDAYYWRPMEDAEATDVSDSRPKGIPSASR